MEGWPVALPSRRGGFHIGSERGARRSSYKDKSGRLGEQCSKGPKKKTPPESGRGASEKGRGGFPLSRGEGFIKEIRKHEEVEADP